MSIGLTSHHDAMIERFPACKFGVSGENLIVESDRTWSLDDLADGVVIETAGGEIAPRSLRVAAPCAEFTSFLLDLDTVGRRDEISLEMAFLDAGTRGSSWTRPIFADQPWYAWVTWCGSAFDRHNQHEGRAVSSAVRT